MTGRAPSTTLAEDLILLCEDPRSGRISPPRYFQRALAGAALAEFAWRGVIVLHGARIAEVRPRPVGEPVADSLLAELVDDVRRGMPGRRQILLTEGEPPVWPTASDPGQRAGRLGAVRDAMLDAAAQVTPAWDLEQWVAAWPRRQDHLFRRHREAMAARGLLNPRGRRVLGVGPFTGWYPATPGHGHAIGPRIDHAVHAPHRPPGSPALRDAHLAALAAAADLTTRLLPGEHHRTSWHRAAELVHTDPVARAVRAVVAADRAAHTGPGD